MIDKQYDQTSHRVFVHVRWQLPFSHIGIRQRLVWHNLDHSDQVDAGRTGHIPKDAGSTSAILKLKPDSEYKLIVSIAWVKAFRSIPEFRILRMTLC